MSLSAQEQQALESIEDDLTGSDPKLASLLATFTRLTSSEEMPVREKIRAHLGRPAGRWHRNRRYPRRSSARWPAFRLWRRLGWPRVLVLLSLTAVVVAAVAVITNSGGRSSPCTGSWAFACAHQTPTRSSRPAAPGSG